MIMSQEQAILKGRAQFEQLVALVQTGKVELGQMERDLFQGLLGIGRSLLEAYVVAQGTGDVGQTLEHQGQTLRRLEELHERRSRRSCGRRPRWWTK